MVKVHLISGRADEYPEANEVTNYHGSPWLHIVKVWHEDDEKDRRVNRRREMYFASYSPAAVSHVSYDPYERTW